MTKAIITCCSEQLECGFRKYPITAKNTQLPSLEKYKSELSQVNQLKSKMSKEELFKINLSIAIAWILLLIIEEACTQRSRASERT